MTQQAIKDKGTITIIITNLLKKATAAMTDKQAFFYRARILWPCSLATYQNKEIPINFIQAGGQQADKDILINQSIEVLEFNLIDPIKRLMTKQKHPIAFIEGHGESNSMKTKDISQSLSEYYTVERVTINQQLNAISKYKTIIIAGPDSVFLEKDKFIIDQFLMKGGRILWLVDGARTNMDSLQSQSETVAIAKEINIEDMLFKYGVRINNDLVLDLVSCPIPVKTGEIGGKPQFDFFNWYYFPSIANIKGHPIVKNLNAIRFEFVSSIDTVGNKDIRKTVLLSSSPTVEYSTLLQ